MCLKRINKCFKVNLGNFWVILENLENLGLKFEFSDEVLSGNWFYSGDRLGSRTGDGARRRIVTGF
jgi:hypothetical protein